MKKFLIFVGVLAILTGCTQIGPADRAEVFQVQPNDWVKGNRNAAVTLIEFSDFQCPACGGYYPAVKKLSQDFPNQLRIIYRQFPLTTLHPNGLTAARASEAAGKQGKFWEMHDWLFEHQSEWSDLGTVSSVFADAAVSLGMNREMFMNDLQSSAVADKVDYDRAGGALLQVSATPTFFLNGTKLDPPSSYEEFKKLVEAVIADKSVK